MDGLLAFLAVFFEPGVAYLIFVGAAWAAVIAFFVPGTLIMEVLAGLGVLVGIVGLLSPQGNILGLTLLIVSFIVYAFADLRVFSAEKDQPVAAVQQQKLTLSLLATGLQVVGGLTLMSSLAEISLAEVIVVALVSLATHLWIVTPVVSALRPPPQSGVETLIGARAVVRRAPQAPGKQGMVFLNGELWQAVADHPLVEGDEVEITGREGMRLRVQKVGHDHETN